MNKKILFLFLVFFITTSYVFGSLPAFRTEGYQVMQTKQLSVPGGSSVPIVYDWDNDGKKDLIIANAYMKIYIYFNNGSDANPSFSEKTLLLRDNLEPYFAGQFVNCFISSNSDLNADGKDDFLLCVDGKVSVYTNLTRSRMPSINNTPINLNFSGMFDQIGEDMATPTRQYKKSGWPVVVDYTPFSTGLELISAVSYTSNINGMDTTINIILIYTNFGLAPTTYIPMTIVNNGINPIYEVNSFGESLSYAFIIDWNKDGTNDIIFSYTSPSINMLTNAYGCESEYSLFKYIKGTVGSILFGVFKSAVSLTNALVPFAPLNIGFRPTPFVCDWDNDTNWDIVSGEYLGNVTILQKASDTRIMPHATVGFQGVVQQSSDCDLYPGNAAQIIPMDWDKDGDWDLLTACGANGQHYIFINYGNNSSPLFQKGQIIQNNMGGNIVRGPKDHAFSTYYDLNGDGKRDLVIGGEYIAFSPQLAFVSNVGTDANPQFTSKALPIKAGGKNISIFNVAAQFADMNGDGKVDLVISAIDTKVGYALNLGTVDANTGLPDFGEIQYLTVGPAKDIMLTGGVPSIPNILNWDKEDGTRDIVAAAGSRVIYFLDTGTASVPYYEEKQEARFDRDVLNAGEYASATIFDWDQDGYYDIFICNTTDKIYKYRGMQLRYVGEDQELMPEDSVYTFPNPLKQGDALSFKFLTRDDALVTIEVFANSGKLIDRVETTAYFDKINTFTYDCGNFANGIYIFRIMAKSVLTDEEQTVLKKFVILR
ncbi:MAG: T9SS type A sorting domain-containing protein [Spirochaetes bacterium]|nr:T9SS type A sorting domain-containing protein [Spirochaetota bacterium]